MYSLCRCSGIIKGWLPHYTGNSVPLSPMRKCLDYAQDYLINYYEKYYLGSVRRNSPPSGIYFEKTEKDIPELIQELVVLILLK